MKKFYRLVSTLLICALVAGSPVASLRTYAEGVPDTKEVTTEDGTTEEIVEETTIVETVSGTETETEPVTETEPENETEIETETETETVPEAETEETVTEESETDTEAPETGTSVLECLDMDEITPEFFEKWHEEANLKLEEIRQDKPVYALVYLTDAYEVRAEATVSSNIIATLPSASTVEILGVKLESPESLCPWYQVGFYVGDMYFTGYIQKDNLVSSDEVFLQWERNYLSVFRKQTDILASYSLSATASDVEQFPTSYQTKLSALKKEHPNWVFVPMNVNKDFTTCVKKQLGDYSWIYYNQPAEFRGAQINSTWYYASEAGIRYYMDPRNFLNSSDIFQFEQNTFNASYHSQSALQSFLNGTFMAGTIPDDSSKRTYAKVIYDTGKDRGISPFNLAARIIQEQGKSGNSAMISGTYSGYEGYYNHYNIGASGKTNAEVLKNGLTYAKNAGWNSRYKSIAGGSKFIGNNYILKGQDTLYLQKFDITKDSGFHQYMQNIMAPYTEGRSMKSMYADAGSLESKFVFKIPVFQNMGGLNYTISPKSMTLDKGTTKTIIIKENGYKFDPSKVTFSSADETIATVSEEGVVTAVDNGKTTIYARFTSEKDKIELKCTVTVVTKLQYITLDKESITLLRDDEILKEEWIQVSYFPEDTTDDRTVVYKTSNKTVATVAADPEDNSRALIKAVGEGTATITATVGTKKATCLVTVEVPMLEAKLNKNEVSLFAGQKDKLMVQYAPMDTTDSTAVTWISDNEDIVTVDNGTITAVSEGTTTIRAAIGPFTGEEEALTCTVTVGKCQVKFIDVDETVFLEEELSFGDKLESLTTKNPWEMPVKEGKTFLGWYTQKDGQGTRVTTETVVYDHLTVYAYYEDNTQGFFVKPIGDMVYTGSAIKPQVEVYDKDILLTQGKDYTVSYKNNKKVNDASVEKTAPYVLVKGKGAYTGSQKVYFKIVPKELTDGDIAVSDLLTAYNKKTQKLSPTVTRAGKKLKKNTDYTLSYPDSGKTGAYLRSGTYPVVITGKGGYSGSVTAQIEITPRVLISKVTLTKPKNILYDGNEQEPIPRLRYKGKDLVIGTDFLLDYENNTEIGTATITITGIGDYIGTRTTTFKITGNAMSKAKISGIVAKEYTGEAITQYIKTDLDDETEGVLVTDSKGNLLREGVHYTVRYEKNINKGTAYMYFTGIDTYSGTVRKSFKINAYNIGKNLQFHEGMPAFSDDTGDLIVEYEKGGAKPKVTVSFKGNTLTEKTDYTLSYKNNNALHDGIEEKKIPTITIKGKGNFTGNFTKTFAIVEKDIKEVKVTCEPAVYKEKKNAWKKVPVLTDVTGKKLTAGKDYDKNIEYFYATDVMLSDGTIRSAGEEVQSTDIPTPGDLYDAKITAVITGIGPYHDTTHVTYRIIPASISGAKVTITKQTYIGKDIPVTLTKDDITIKLSGETLLPEDYEIVSYQKNTVKGTAKVTLKGVGKYGGTKTVSYTIKPKTILWWKN